MYCACKYYYDRSLTDIAKSFSVSVSGLTRGRDCVKESLVENKALIKVVKKVEPEIGKGRIIKNQ